jgi:hypothetical protein
VIIGKLIPAGTGFPYTAEVGDGELMFEEEEPSEPVDLEAEAVRRLGLDEIAIPL